MPVVTLRQESLDQGSFYVPQFEVRIEGAGLPRDVLRDVTEVTYKDGIKEIDSFEFTVNNWDPTTRNFKYSGAESAETMQGNTPESQRFRLFEPCNKEVEVRMGYRGDLRVMLKGTFTTMEPNFPASGPPTLAVRGLNVLHQLRRKQYSTSWGDKKDSEIAENIATLIDKELGNKAKRFPLPIVTDKAAKGLEKPIPYVAQKSQYDIDFLFSRARQRGYVVFVLEADPNGRGLERQRRLYFGPSQGDMPGLRDVTFELKWGASLIDFKPTLTTANQVRSVTVNGWNRATKKSISEKVTLDDKRLNINRDLHEVLKSCDPREEMVVDEPVFTVAQAKERAIAILMDRHKEMVKASATCVGLPDLRAGQRVQIEGLGSRFSGTYFITETTHTIGDSGYTTKFNARREDKGAGSSA
jgi:phage protein D